MNDIVKEYDLDIIRRVINTYFDVDIKQKCKNRKIVYARQLACYFAAELTIESWNRIGTELVDYSYNCAFASVRHSINNVKNMLIYSRFKKDFDTLQQHFIELGFEPKLVRDKLYEKKVVS